MIAFMFETRRRASGRAEVPLGRIGRPDESPGLALFLASRTGAYLTGTIIPLDGGITGCG